MATVSQHRLGRDKNQMLSLRKKGRVLLLDDDASMQRLVSTLLKKQNYRVDVVGNGRAAIDALTAVSYDALLLDLMMPHEGGMTVIQHLRTTNPALLARVAILTATPEGVLRDLSQEVAAVIIKPFESANLIQTVARLVGG